MTRTDTPFWKWLLLLIAGSFLFILAYGFSSIPTALDEAVNMPLWLQAILCVLTSAGVLALYALWWKWTEKRKATDLPMRRLAGDTALGFGVGILFFILVTGCIALLGGYRIGSVNWDWNALIKSLFMFLVVGVGEEVLFRGIVFRMIDDRWGTVAPAGRRLQMVRHPVGTHRHPLVLELLPGPGFRFCCFGKRYPVPHHPGHPGVRLAHGRLLRCRSFHPRLRPGPDPRYRVFVCSPAYCWHQSVRPQAAHLGARAVQV